MSWNPVKRQADLARAALEAREVARKKQEEERKKSLPPRPPKRETYGTIPGGIATLTRRGGRRRKICSCSPDVGDCTRCHKRPRRTRRSSRRKVF